MSVRYVATRMVFRAEPLPSGHDFVGVAFTETLTANCCPDGLPKPVAAGGGGEICCLWVSSRPHENSLKKTIKKKPKLGRSDADAAFRSMHSQSILPKMQLRAISDG